jgi:hypothetical protein
MQMTAQTTMDDRSINLPLPLQNATPAPRCGVCAALAQQRSEAAAAGDFSKASERNVEIRNHSHPSHRARS